MGLKYPEANQRLDDVANSSSHQFKNSEIQDILKLSKEVSSTSTGATFETNEQNTKQTSSVSTTSKIEIQTEPDENTPLIPEKHKRNNDSADQFTTGRFSKLGGLLWQTMGFQLFIVLLAALIFHFGHSQAKTTKSTSTSACTTSTISKQPGSTQNLQLCIDGKTQRSYVLFIPKNYADSSSPKSLIVSYHGATRTAQSQLELDKLTDTYFNKDAIVVYPQGVGETWQGTPNVPPTDVDFTQYLLTTLSGTLNINPSRIYATGKSQGGGMVGVLACDSAASKLFAAFAPVSGAFYTTVAAKNCKPDSVQITCNPGRSNIPFIEFHGGADDTILYAGDARKGVCLPSIPHYITQWATRNGLSAANSSAPFSLDTTEYSFGNGLVRSYFGKKVGHDWPSTLSNADNSRKGHAPATYNASEVIVEFFKKYSLS